MFKYLFTRSKKDRDTIWDNMQKKYESSLNDLAIQGEQVQKLMVKYHEVSSKEKPSLGKHSK